MTYFFSPTTVMLCGLLALPLLAQAQTCVQNNLPSNPTAVYTVHGDGTVTDRRTGLMWAQCLAGQSGTQCATAAPIPMDWAAALAYAQSQTLAGYHDWRLPSAKELRTLVEHCRTQPAINEVVFPAQTFDPIAEQGVWTATPDVRDASRAWYIDFETGAQGKALRSTADRHTVRLVRGGLSLLPQWSGVALSGSPTAHSASIVATSNQSGRGYFLVVRRGSTAPTPAQVKNPVGQGYVPPRETSGFSVITANTPTTFGVLVSENQTDYDFYLVAESSAGVLGSDVVKVEFRTAAPASVDGSCGSAHGGTALWTSTPASNLCSAGTASSVTGATSTWTWSCDSTNGGASALCQAPRGYTVTPSAGVGGTITPATAQTVAYQATPSFQVTAQNGYTLASVGGSCGGNLSGTAFTTAPVSQDCTVQAVFNAAPPPATYAITATASPAAGGSVSCSPSLVTHGGNSTCTATPHAGYRFHAWMGACASQSATCTLNNIQAAQASTAVFSYEITVPEGPWTGQPIVVTPPAQNNWVITSASTAPTSSIATPPPSTVELPQGIVALQLATGTAGSSATVVLTYPEPLPAGTTYYKFGKTLANPTDHWYEFSGAVISGNTITLTLTDGGAGDNDLKANSLIDDPGGPALLKAKTPGAVQSIPTLSEWGMMLLTGLLGLFAAAAMRRGRSSG